MPFFKTRQDHEWIIKLLYLFEYNEKGTPYLLGIYIINMSAVFDLFPHYKYFATLQNKHFNHMKSPFIRYA